VQRAQKFAQRLSECRAARGRDASREERRFERHRAGAGVVHHDRVLRAVKVVHRRDGDGRVGRKMGAHATQGVHFEILEWVASTRRDTTREWFGRRFEKVEKDPVALKSFTHLS
jgi:hypothetical protein